MTTQAQSEVLTLREAAAYLKIHYVTAYRQAERGMIPGHKFGKVWRFHRSVLEKLLKGELESQPQGGFK